MCKFTLPNSYFLAHEWKRERRRNASRSSKRIYVKPDESAFFSCSPHFALFSSYAVTFTPDSYCVLSRAENLLKADGSNLSSKKTRPVNDRESKPELLKISKLAFLLNDIECWQSIFGIYYDYCCLAEGSQSFSYFCDKFSSSEQILVSEAIFSPVSLSKPILTITKEAQVYMGAQTLHAEFPLDFSAPLAEIYLHKHEGLFSSYTQKNLKYSMWNKKCFPSRAKFREIIPDHPRGVLPDLPLQLFFITGCVIL